ncbi:O-antigen polymerase [Paenibacillus sp. 1001270B_150601_E10]|uniref:O-antigen polymerase n=1 Tax=Paenibacillus sp. 1001270B_150601_E10 TaxID=2787079 RepID=UPI00189C609E|nr:O-antigen polymerase [Paenibacillus sp. 1001270B_150601_E10]
MTDQRKPAQLSISLLFICTFAIYASCLWLLKSADIYGAFLLSTCLIILILPLWLTKDTFHPFILYIGMPFFSWINYSDKLLNGYSIRYSLDDSGGAKTYIELSILMFAVWLGCMLLGYVLSNLAAARKSAPIRAGEHEERRYAGQYNFLYPKGLAAILLAISIASFGYIFMLQGGMDAMLAAMVNRREEYEGLAYIRNMVSLGGVSALLFLFGGAPKRGIAAAVLTTAMMMLFGGRGAALLGVLLPFGIVYHYFIRRLSFALLAPVAAGVLLIALMWGNMRMEGEMNLSVSGLGELMFKAGNQLQTADIVPAIVSGVDSGLIAFTYGEPITRIFYAPIPRSIWPNKPITDETGVVGYTLMGPDYWGLPAGNYGWAYFNFGWLGVIVLGVLTGACVWIWKRQLLEKRRSHLTMVLYASTIVYISQIFAASAQIKVLWMCGICLLLLGLDQILKLLFKGKHGKHLRMNSVIDEGSRHGKENTIRRIPI